MSNSTFIIPNFYSLGFQQNNAIYWEGEGPWDIDKASEIEKIRDTESKGTIYGSEIKVIL